jgi:hypothetical protein
MKIGQWTNSYIENIDPDLISQFIVHTNNFLNIGFNKKKFLEDRLQKNTSKRDTYSTLKHFYFYFFIYF